MERLRGRVGVICLALYLLLVGAIALVGVAVPGWVAAALAIVAGILLLVGL